MMNIISFTLALLILIKVTPVHAESNGVLLYGIIDQSKAISVFELNNGMLNWIVAVNDLKPSVVKEDWRRHFFRFTPLFIKESILYYYLPKMNSFGLESGVYAKLLGASSEATLVLHTPELISIQKGEFPSSFWIVSKEGKLFEMDLDKRLLNACEEDSVSFASFNVKTHSLLILDKSGLRCKVSNINRGISTVRKVIFFDRKIKSIYAFDDNNKFFVEGGWDIWICNTEGNFLYSLAKKTVTASVCDVGADQVYFLVGGDNDDRLLYSCDLSGKKSKKYNSGMFYDTLTLE